MNVDAFVEAVLEDLGRTAAIGDEATARAAMLLTGLLDSSLRRRFQDAMSEVALELSEQIRPGHVDVRLAGSDLQLVAVDTAGVSEPAPSGGGADEVFSARITLRLPESLKGTLERAAGDAGVSLNSFLVQSLGRACAPRPSTPRGGGRRMTGYGRS